MRVLGIDIQSSDVIAVVIDGTHKQARIEKFEPVRIAFPQVGPEEADNLHLFENQLRAIVKEAKPECVGIIKANSGMYSASPIKVKIECLVQLAARQNNAPCILFSAQKITNLQRSTSKEDESMKKSIEQLDPKYAHKAVFCAWSVLRART